MFRFFASARLMARENITRFIKEQNRDRARYNSFLIAFPISLIDLGRRYGKLHLRPPLFRPRKMYFSSIYFFRNSEPRFWKRPNASTEIKSVYVVSVAVCKQIVATSWVFLTKNRSGEKQENTSENLSEKSSRRASGCLCFQRILRAEDAFPRMGCLLGNRTDSYVNRSRINVCIKVLLFTLRFIYCTVKTTGIYRNNFVICIKLS